MSLCDVFLMKTLKCDPLFNAIVQHTLVHFYILIYSISVLAFMQHTYHYHLLSMFTSVSQ